MAQTDLVTVLRRGWWVLLTLAVLGAGLAFLTRERPDSGPDRWQAKSTIVGSGDASTAEEQIRLRRLGAAALRPPVIDQVAEDLELTTESIRASTVPTLSVKFGGIDLLVTRTSASEAQTIADALTAGVVAQELATAEAERAERVVALYTEVVQLEDQLTDARAALQGSRDPSLIAERDRLQAAITEKTARLIEVQQASSAADDLEVLPSVDAVDVSPAPASTSPVGRTAGGALVGLVLGAAALIVVDRMDPKIRNRRQTEAAFGVPVLTAIASTRTGGPVGGAPAANGYRTLRVALRDHEAGRSGAPSGRHHRTGSLRADGVVQTVLVTSPGSADGRSTVAANLAVALAEIGWQVVLVDAHHAAPHQHVEFGLPQAPGLTDACMDTNLAEPELVDLGPCLQGTAIAGLSLLASGSTLSNPAALMAREPSVLHALRAWADYVIVDCPPVLGSNDALELAGVADAVLLVARSGHTRRAPAARAAELLGLVGAPLFGAVLLGGTAVMEPSRAPMTVVSSPVPAPDPVRAG